MDVVILVVCLLALIIGCGAALLGALALIEIKALKKSTHTIEWIDPLANKMPDPFSKKDAFMAEKAAKDAGLVPLDEDEEF